MKCEYIFWLLVKGCDVFEHPCAACLPAICNFLQLGFVLILEFSNTQAILLCDFRLQNDLYFLRIDLLSFPWVCVVYELIVNDLELDLG